MIALSLMALLPILKPSIYHHNSVTAFNNAGDLNRNFLKQNCRKHKLKLSPESRTGGRFKCNASTYSSRMATDIYLYESPDEEWRVHMLPIQFFFLTCNPVIDMRLRCKTEGYDYPPGVPTHVTKVLDLDIVRWELLGLEDIVKPDEFSLGVKGALYPYRQGNRSRLKGQLTMSIKFDLPPMLSLIPEDVRRDVAQTVLNRLVENMKDKVNGNLLADYSKFKNERTRKLV